MVSYPAQVARRCAFADLVKGAAQYGEKSFLRQIVRERLVATDGAQISPHPRLMGSNQC